MSFDFGGSNPPPSTTLPLPCRALDARHGNGGAALCGSSSVGRASAFQAEGREFESRLPLQCHLELLQIDTTQPCLFSSGVEHFHGKEGVPGSIPGEAHTYAKVSGEAELVLTLGHVPCERLRGKLNGSLIHYPGYPINVEIYDIRDKAHGKGNFPA